MNTITHSNRRGLLLALCLSLLIVMLTATLTASAAVSITVTPNNPQGWQTFGNSGGGSSAITTTAPRSGDGSVEMTGDRTRWIKAVDPTTGAKLGDLYDVTDFAYDWLVAVGSTSNLGPNYTPALRLHVYDPNAALPFSELIWEGAYNGPVVVTQGSWVTTDMIGGSQLLWRWVTGAGVTLDGGGAQVNQTLGSWQNASWYSTDAVVFGFSVGVGSSVGSGYHAFADNLVLGFNNAPDTFNFEPDPQCSTVCYADAVNGDDMNDGITPATAKKTIQAAIDQVDAGGQVRVLPGDYDETATNRYVLGVNGPHQFGLFIEDDTKDGISIIGVTAADVEITDPTATEAKITTNATNNFGYSGIFVEADDVTITGLEIGPNTPGEDKTIEIIGNNFALTNCFMSGDGVDGAIPYVNDWRYDDVNDIAYVTEYTFDNNLFGPGSQIAISSGAGGSGPVSGRVITNNDFTMGTGQNWPSISFNGAGGVAWFTYPVGGAIITGNTFTNDNYGAEQWIRARGDYIEAQFDWVSYWDDNTYDNATVAYDTSLADPRTYAYSVFTNVRRIGAQIQLEIDTVAQPGDTVLVHAGTYPEQVVITKSLELLGSGPATTFIKAPSTMPIASNPDSTIVKIAGAGVSVEIHEFTITGPGPSGCGSLLAGIFVRDGAYANIHDNKIMDIRDTGDSGCQNGHGVLVGRTTLSSVGTADIKDNVIDNYQKTGIIVSYTGSSATIDNNEVLGDGPKTIIAENGIQVSGGATADIKNNTISGHSYTPFTVVSVGVLIFGPANGTIDTDNNTLTGNQVGIYVIDADGTHENNDIGATAANTGSPGFWGIIVDSPPPHRNPAPFEAESSRRTAVTQPTTRGALTVAQTVVVTGNTLISNNSAGGVGLEVDGGFGSFDIDLTATKNLIHNWEYGVYVLECSGSCSGTTFTNVDINRNSIVSNTEYGMFADTLTPVTDGTCNWWGDASGPSDQGPGTGDKVGADITFTPWLYTNNLDGPCYIGGTIEVRKVTDPDTDNTTQFTFDPSWSATNFTLKNGQSKLSDKLPGGVYSVSEINLPSGWTLQSTTCTNGVSNAQPSSIPLEDGDAWVCTFTNKKDTTPPPAGVCPTGTGSTQTTRILGIGMYPNATATVNIPNYAQADNLYAQLAGKRLSAGTTTGARFVPLKNTTQLGTITDTSLESPAYRSDAIFWYGQDLSTYDGAANKVNATLLTGAGSPSGMARALVLYADYPTKNRAQYWNFVGRLNSSSQNMVYWGAGWIQTQTYTVNLPAALTARRDIAVQAAVVDNERDTRPFKLTITLQNAAGGTLMTKSFTLNNPSLSGLSGNANMLNLIKYTFKNAPVGTAKIVFTLESPRTTGDSVALVGVAANYVCVK